jgi:tetratricopeptide (TPR) repeat protein
MNTNKIISFNSNEYNNKFVTFLKKKNYDIIDVTTSVHYRNIENLDEFEAVLFDSRLRWENKFEILEWIRDKNFKIPLIIFFGKNEIDLDKYYKYCVSEYIDLNLQKLKFFKYFKQTLRNKHKMYLHYYHIAELFHLQSDYGEAIKLYKNSLKINSNFINSYISLFYIYIKKRMNSRAERIFTQMKEINPPSFIITNLRIYLEYLRKNYKKVIFLANKMENDEQIYDSNVYKYQLLSYLKTKKYLAAFKVFIKLWGGGVNLKKSLINTIKIHKNFKNHNSLYRASKNAVEIFPESDFINRCYILSLYRRGKIDKINKFLKKQKKYKKYFAGLVKNQ